jgi:hypothetical protein
MIFPTIPEDLSALSDQEIAELLNELVTAFNEATAEGVDISAEDIALLSAAADDVERLRTEEGVRSEAAAEREAQIVALSTRVNGQTEGEGEGTEVTTTEGEGDDAGAGEGGEGEGGDAGTSTTEGEGEGTEGEGAQPTAVAASATGPTVQQLARRAPARTRPRPTADAESPVTILAGANLPGIQAGSELRNVRDISRALFETFRTLGKSHIDGDRVTVAQFNLAIPEDRQLSASMTPEQVMDRLRSFDTTPAGIQAAGGLCAPVANYYDQLILAERGRPVRDALATFGADRGGIKFNPPPTLADITSGVGIVTEANDAAGTSNTKGYFAVTCAAAQEVHTNAVYNQLDFGNWYARTFQEGVDAWTQLALALHDRVAETQLLDLIAAGSTPVTASGLVGAGRELFARLGQAAAVYRNRHRMNPDAPLRVLLPAWTLELVGADFARTFTDDQGFIQMGRADIERLFGQKNLNVSWYIDSKTGGGQLLGTPNGGRTVTDGATNSNTTVTSATAAFSADDVGKTITGTGIPANTTISAVGSATSVTISQAATATATGVTLRIGANVLAQFPSTVYAYMFAEGTWLFLDGGTLDLGLVRDNTSNATNRFRTFSETFESAAKVGPESLEIALNLYPDGTYGAAKTITRPIVS